jgi:hypothetical protein
VRCRGVRFGVLPFAATSGLFGRRPRDVAVAAITLVFVGFNGIDTTVRMSEAQFDAVTIKRSASREVAMRRRHMPGREIFENTPVQQLLLEAYGADARELIDVPDWVSNERYDIAATYSQNPRWTSRQPIWRMLQVLLEERFAVQAQRGQGMLRVDRIERPATN